MKIVRDINMLWDIKKLLKALKGMRKDDTISRRFCLCTKGKKKKNNEKEGIYHIISTWYGTTTYSM